LSLLGVDGTSGTSPLPTYKNLKGQLTQSGGKYSANIFSALQSDNQTPNEYYQNGYL
jgi:hypothetical protein